MEPRQEYWIDLSFPLPGDLPNPGIEPGSPTLAGGFFITEPPGKLLDWAFLLKSKICQILLKKNNNFLKWELPGSPAVKGLPWCSDGKYSAYNAGDSLLILGSGMATHSSILT